MNPNPNQYGNRQGRRINNGTNSNNGGGGGNGRGPTRDTWRSPFQNRDQNVMFFMYAYKCDPCQLRRNCPSKVTCPGWHHEGEKRRNPGEYPNYNYSEEPCPHVKPQGSNKWQPPSRCTNGDECGYSHTLLEQMYHPNIYKTSMCINFTNPRGNKCQWGYYCTHAHGSEDIRNPNDTTSSGNRSVGNASEGNANSQKQKTGNTNMTVNMSTTANVVNHNSPNMNGFPNIRSVSDGTIGNHYQVQSNQWPSNQVQVSPNTNLYAMKGNTMNGGPTMHYPANLPNQHTTNTSPYLSNTSPNTSMNSGNRYQSNHSPSQNATPSQSQLSPNKQGYHNQSTQPQPPHQQPPHQQPRPGQQEPYNSQIHYDYHKYFETQMRPKGRSISAPPKPNENVILNRFPQGGSPHETPLPDPGMIPSNGAFNPYASNSPPIQGSTYFHHNQQSKVHSMKTKRSRSVHEGMRGYDSLPKLDSSFFRLPTRTASDGLASKMTGLQPMPTPQRRTQSISEPLKPDPFILDRYNWDLTAPSGSAENIRPRQSLAKNSSASDSKPTGNLSSIPDHDDSNPFDGLLSPGTLAGIITPKTQENEKTSDGISPSSADGAPKKESIPRGTWDVFGFQDHEVMSPTDVTTTGGTGPRPRKSKSASYVDAYEMVKPALSNRASLKLPTNPSTTDDVEDTQNLKRQLEDAQKEIARLRMEKNKHGEDQDDRKRKKEEEARSPLAVSSGTGDASKKSINLFLKQKVDLSEDQKSEELVPMMDQPPLYMEDCQSPPITELQVQQLARYQHFITCPSCKVIDKNSPRNQVLVPCGHLLCTKCTGGGLKACPLCQKPVEGLQELVIG